MSNNHSQPTAFSERLLPSVGFWISSFVLALTLGAGLWFANKYLGYATFLLVMLACSWFMLKTAPKYQLSESIIQAGEQSVSVWDIGEVSVLTQEELQQELGPELSATAHLIINGYKGAAIKFQITDLDNPVPYWILSTRKATDFAAAITAAQNKSATVS